MAAPSDEERSRQVIGRMLESAIPRFLELKARGHARRLLIIDDGGLAIESAVLGWPELAPHFVAVEQTRRGAKLLRATHPDRLVFPIVNVAESRSKLELESPIIGESVVRCVDERLRESGASLAGVGRMLVVGFGSVGAAVARAARARGVDVRVADVDGRRDGAAAEQGFPAASLRSAARDGVIALGCTGVEWMSPDEISGPEDGDVILASASTADVEFRALKRLPLSRIPYPPEAEGCGSSAFRTVHSDYSLPTGARHFLLNGGYPVNFDGSVDPIPPRVIQLTRALILAGACSAVVSAGVTGLVPLPSAMDRLITQEFTALDSSW